MSAPRVLVLHGNGQDYLADAVLHGLRLVLGEGVVDVPRRDPLYEDFPADRAQRLVGHAFTLYRRLPDVEVERDWWLHHVLQGDFDVVVFADVWTNWGPWVQLRPHLGELRRNGVTLVALDGGDGEVLYPFGPTWWKQMRPWPLPRVNGRMATFKRELSPVTAWMRCYGLVPPRLAARLVLRDVRPIAFAIPEDCITTGDDAKTQLLATHVVDPEVAALLPHAQGGYAFDTEAAYYADLRAARFGITTKRAGWEALRHYELAANGCVPCFRDLHRKPATCAPFGLDESNCVPYTDARELLRTLEAMDDSHYARLRAGALAWARANTTRARALELLRAIGRPAVVGEPTAATVS